MDFYTSGIEKAKSLWIGSQAARKRAEAGEATGADVVALLTVVTRYRALLEALKTAEKDLPTLIAQLYWVWDKVLVDMEIQEGEVVSFRQKFQINRHRVVIVPEGKEAEEGQTAESKSDEPKWEPGITVRFYYVGEGMSLIPALMPGQTPNVDRLCKKLDLSESRGDFGELKDYFFVLAKASSRSRNAR